MTRDLTSSIKKSPHLLWHDLPESSPAALRRVLRVPAEDGRVNYAGFSPSPDAFREMMKEKERRDYHGVFAKYCLFSYVAFEEKGEEVRSLVGEMCVAMLEFAEVPFKDLVLQALLELVKVAEFSVEDIEAMIPGVARVFGEKLPAMESDGEDVDDVLPLLLERAMEIGGFDESAVAVKLSRVICDVMRRKNVSEGASAKVFRIWKGPISELNESAVDILCDVRDYVEEQRIEALRGQLPLIMLENFRLKQRVVFPVPQRRKPVVIEWKSPVYNFKFENLSYIRQEVDLQASLPYQIYPIESFVPNCREKLNLFVKLSNGNVRWSDVLGNNFWKGIATDENDHLLDECGFYVNFWKQCLENTKGEVRFPVPQALFDPSFEMTEELFNLQFHAITCILMSHYDVFAEFVQEIRSFPLVAANVVEILVLQLKLFVESFVTERRVKRRLLDLFVQPDESFDQAQKEAVSTLEQAVMKLLGCLPFREDERVLRAALKEESAIFREFLFSLLFDESLKGFACSILKLYISKFGIGDLVNSFGRLFEQINCSLSDHRSIALLGELLDIINVSSKDKCAVGELSEKLAATVDRLDASEQAQTFVEKTISFHVLLSMSRIEISDTYFNALEKYLTRIEHVSNVMLLLLIQLMAGSDSRKIEPSFVVANGRVLLIMLRTLFLRKIEGFNFLDFCDDLCTFSFRNCIRLHHCGFDLALLDVVSRMRAEDDPNIGRLLDVFFDICRVVSSPTVVRMVFSLFTPLDGRYLTASHSELVVRLGNLFDNALNLPLVSVPISNVHQHIKVGQSEFALLCRMCAEYKAKEEQFLQLSFRSGLEHGQMTVTLSHRNMVLMVNGEKTGLELPRNQWTTLAMHHDSQGQLYWWVNGNRFKQERLKLWPDIHSFSIDGKSNEILFEGYELLSHIEPEQPLHFGSNSNVVNASQRLAFKNDCDSIWSFVYVFVEYFKIETMIPLFAQLDLEMIPSSKDTEGYAVQIAETLFSVFMFIGDNLDASDMEAFSALAYVLQNISERHITYVLFQSLYGLYCEARKQVVKRALRDDIVLNFRIWLRAKEEDHVQILDFLDRNMKDDIPVEDLLRDLVSYYWNEENDVGNAPCVKADIDLSAFRKAIVGLISRAQLTNDQFRRVLNCLRLANEDLQKRDILEIILRCNVEGLTKSCVTQLDQYLRDVCDGTSDAQKGLTDETLLLLLRAVSHIHAMISSGDDKQHVQVAFFLKDRQLTGDALFKAIAMLETCPEYFELVSAWVFESKEVALHKILPPSDKYCVRPCWCRWSVKASLVLPITDFTNAMTFLLECSFRRWTDVYRELVQQTRDNEDYNFGYFRRKFIMALGNMDPVSKHDADSFVSLLFSTIFYRRGLHSEGLLQAFRASEYPQMSSTSESDCSYHYGLDVDINGQLKEMELMPYVLSLPLTIADLSSQQLRPVLLLAAHVARTKPDMTNASLLNWELTDEQVRRNRDILRLMERVRNHRYSDGETCGNTVSLSIVPVDFAENWERSVLSQMGNDQTTSPQLNLNREGSAHNFGKISEPSEDKIPKKSWHKLWNRVTSEGGPWWSASYKREIKWMRDPVLCAFMCPMKMKINHRFDDHLEAALTRELGSAAHADQVAKKYRQIQKEQHQVESHTNLLKTEGTRSHNLAQSRSASSIIQEMIESGEMPERQASIPPPKTNAPVPVNHDKKSDHSCSLVSITGRVDGTFEIEMDNLIRISVHDQKNALREHNLKLRNIRFVLPRTCCHEPTAIEIFCTNGKSYFVDFAKMSYKEEILRKLKGLHIPTSEERSIETLVSQWKSREISTFEYLLCLNRASGRTFNDASQYVFLPWVIQDYQSETLDLKSPHTFRDLAKPVGALNEERLEELRERMAYMKTDPYLYSSYAVCPLSVYLWLIRMEPFTSMHIQMQSRKFDHGSRIFSSIGDSYTFVCKNLNNYRELLPEFYYCPDFLLNENCFDLGKNKDEDVNDVVLPPWAHSPWEFVYLMRKALECDYVSEHIHEWIDLIWGYKQRGKEAQKADNLFKSDMYDDVWDKHANLSQSRRLEIRECLKHFGQVPKQLFIAPHPPRGSRPPQREFSPKDWSLQDPSIPNSDVLAAWIDFDKGSNQCILKLAVKDYLVKYSCLVGESAETPQISDRQAHPLEVSVFASETVWLCRNGHVDGVGSFPDRATAIAQDGDYRGIVVDESTLRIIHKSGVPVAAIPFFGEAITCCDISAAFKLAVCGTRANKIYTCSLFKDSKTRAIDLGDLTPKMVLITKAWGFIIAHAESPSGENFLLVFDVNGHQIRKTPIKFSIAAWRTFASSDAFDYLVIATTTRQIYVTEVFYCDLGAPIDRTTAPIVAVSFIPSKSVIVAVTSQRVHFVSHSL